MENKQVKAYSIDKTIIKWLEKKAKKAGLSTSRFVNNILKGVMDGKNNR